MKSEKAAAAEEDERGNEVKGCEGIPSFFSAVNHSAGARDTKEPVCEFMCVCLNGAIGPRLDNEPPSLCGHAGASEGQRGKATGGKEYEEEERREEER